MKVCRKAVKAAFDFVERLWLLILYIVISMCATFGQGSLMTGYFVVVTSFCRGGCWFCRTRTCLWDPVAKGCKMSFIRVGLWFYRTCIGKILVHDPIGGAELIVGVLQIEGSTKCKTLFQFTPALCTKSQPLNHFELGKILYKITTLTH